MKRILILSSMMFLTGIPAFAQMDVTADVSIMVDDNVNNNALNLNDRILTAELGASYDFTLSGEEAQLGYAGTFGMFEAITDRSYSAHSLGLTISGSTGDEYPGLYRINVGGGIRRNNGVYSFYDNAQAGLSGSFRQTLMEGLTAQAGYTFRRVLFRDASFFSYGEHLATVNMTLNTQSRTTIIGFGELGRKSYLEGVAMDQASQTSGVTQWVLGIRLAQGIAERTGISVSAKYQWNPEKQSRYLISDLGMLSDDELFDDRYGYEGAGLTAMLTQVVWDGAYLRLSYGLQEKYYGLLPAFDWEGTMIADHREDRRTYVTLLGRTGLGVGAMDLTVSATLIRNGSNDPYYDYRNTAVSAGLSIPF